MIEKLSNCPICGSTDYSLFLEVEDYFLTKENFYIQKCGACGFKFLNPRPGPNEIDRYYQSDEYISHDAKNVNIIGRIYKLARVFSINSKFTIVKRHIKSGRILDIGCGTGEFLHYCKSKGFNVDGVEPNEKAGKFAKQVNGIPVYRSISDLITLKSSFNCITMWHVLEHVHDLNETIEQVRTLLDPEGVFIVAVPNSNSWDAQKYGKFWAAYDVPRHLYHFIYSTLNNLALKHGFEIIETKPQILDAFYVSMLSEKYKQGNMKYFRMLLIGLWSNFQARKSDRGHSSQIFMLKIKKT